MGKQGNVIINGQKLKAAREAKGLSIPKMAALVTLSRAQVLQIEQGGEQAFYNVKHKILAIRKYASALSVPFEQVVGTEKNDQKPEALDEVQHAMLAQAKRRQTAATELPLAWIVHNESRRRSRLIVIVLLCAIISFYIIDRAARDRLPSEHILAEEAKVQESFTHLSREGAPQGVAVTAPATGHGEKNITQSAAPALAMSDPESKLIKTTPEHCQPEPAGSELHAWSPSYQRKPGSRLYVTSSQGGVICISDANGKLQLLDLKPMTGQAFTGKPPYIVRSSHLSKFDMYLQGMRVKIPVETEIMKLIPNPDTTPIFSQNNGNTVEEFNP